MDINSLLKGVDNCPCGQTHTCQIQAVHIEKNALSHLAELCQGYQNIVLVADNNTYPLCGKQAAQILGDSLSGEVIFQRTGLLVPNEEAVAEIEAAVTQETDLLIGIGSGVINDLCKYVSFHHKLPYYIIATAPSMDGYASTGAAMIMENMKITYTAHVPTAILADVDILKDAPIDMIQSGFGDIIGKYSALNDWLLSELVNGEHLCRYVYDLVYDTVLKTQDLAAGIRNREPEAVGALMEALVIVGIAMSFVGNSRPASGSEHHLSHYFELTGILNHEDYFLHGIDVVYSAVQTQLLREQILQLEQFPEQTYIHDPENWKKQIRDIYSAGAEGIIALQNKTGYYEKDYPTIYKEKWQKIRGILSLVPSSEKLLDILQTIGLSYADFQKAYGEEKIQKGIWFAKDLKDRYTVLWLYYLLFYKG